MTGGPVIGGAIHASALLVVLALYFLPSIVAIARKVTHQGSVIVINVFLGWTFIGWVVALAMACRTRRVSGS
jgi:putative effector of murein hydrolase LrgA (UPF0299 family)